MDGSNVTDARRRDIGMRLAEIGDTRPGVGLRDGVPDTDWVSISPGGSFDIEGRPKSVSPFYLARYPVTYAQYEAFVNAGDGFSTPAWWRSMPAEYRPPQQGLSAQKNQLGNAPREDVSWYQAVAFTRWLTLRLQAGNASFSSGGARVSGVPWEVRLPTEWEWRWAAQSGSEKRDYPWGYWQAGRANIGEVLTTTISVGMYPQGAAVSGALDMSGNVWEWCLNDYYPPYSSRVDTTDNKAARGGAFDNIPSVGSSSTRDDYHPNYNLPLPGFRVGLFPSTP